MKYNALNILRATENYKNPLVQAGHSYPWLILRLTYRLTNHVNWHVHGYKEEGTTTTSFDMTELNELNRYHLVYNIIAHVPKLQHNAVYLKQFIRDRLIYHQYYITEHGKDMPEISNWQWPKPNS